MNWKAIRDGFIFAFLLIMLLLLVGGVPYLLGLYVEN